MSHVPHHTTRQKTRESQAAMQFTPKVELKIVQGQSLAAQALPSITPTNTPSPTTTITPTPTRKPAIKKRTPTIKKEQGGWYWRPELGRAQRWLGTDSQGKDIWSDTNE